MSQVSSPFSPPEGLQPNESVLWVRQSETMPAGTVGKPGIIAIILFGGLFLAVGLFYNILPILGFGILIMLGGIAAGYNLKTKGGVRYYLTNFRFVKANHGRIITELSRRVFRGKSFNQFLSIYPAPMQRGSISMFAVQVLNPESGNMAMNLGLLPEEVVKRLESINDEVYCQYCGRKNEPSSNICANCGANL